MRRKFLQAGSISSVGSLNRRLGSGLYAYGIPELTVASALLITESLKPTIFPTPLFFAAIVISTWYGGTGPGVVAVALATLVLDFFFVSPTRGFTFRASDLPNMAQFVLPAFLSGWFTKKRKEAETALQEARDQLDAKVQQRTAPLHNTNEKLQSEITGRKRTGFPAAFVRSPDCKVGRVFTRVLWSMRFRLASSARS